jgi:transposase
MISNEVKNIALRLVDSGMSKKQTARICSVSLSTLKSWLDPDGFAKRRAESRQRCIERNSEYFTARLERERLEAARLLVGAEHLSP